MVMEEVKCRMCNGIGIIGDRICPLCSGYGIILD